MSMPTAKLGDVCTTVSGGTPPRTKYECFGGEIPWVKITDMLQGVVTTTEETLTHTGLKSCSAKILPAGTVLISVFATIGRTAVLGRPAATNQAIAGVVPNDPDALDPAFLRYFLDSKRQELTRAARGVAQPNINQSILRGLDVPVPSVQEQRRIVDLLSRAEGIVRLRREAQQKAAELIPAIFIDMFGDPATNPKSWPTSAIERLCPVQTGATPRKEERRYYEGGTVPWVRTGEVQGRQISEVEERITELALADTNCKVFPVDTILVAMYGQGQTRGRSGMLKTPAATNQACAAILPSNEINARFLFEALNLQYDRLRAMGRGGNQENLNLGMIKELQVPCPPLDMQLEFVGRCIATGSILDQQAAATDKALATFYALMSRAFD